MAFIGIQIKGRSKSKFSVGSDATGAKNVGLFNGDVAIVPSLKAGENTSSTDHRESAREH